MGLASLHWLSLKIVLFNCFDSIYKAIGYLLQGEDPLSSARHLTQEIRNWSNTRKNSQHPVIREVLGHDVHHFQDAINRSSNHTWKIEWQNIFFPSRHYKLQFCGNWTRRKISFHNLLRTETKKTPKIGYEKKEEILQDAINRSNQNRIAVSKKKKFNLADNWTRWKIYFIIRCELQLKLSMRK